MRVTVALRKRLQELSTTLSVFTIISIGCVSTSRNALSETASNNCLTPDQVLVTPSYQGNVNIPAIGSTSDGSLLLIHSNDLSQTVQQTLTPGYYAFNPVTSGFTLLSILPDGTPAEASTIGRDALISGDGRYFAFTVDQFRPANSQLYLRDIGAGITLVNTPDQPDAYIGVGIDSVTSDGSYLFYTLYTVGDFTQAYVSDLKNRVSIQLSSPSFRNKITFSRDGRSYGFEGSHAPRRGLRGQVEFKELADGSTDVRLLPAKKIIGRPNEFVTLPRAGRTYLAFVAAKEGSRRFAYGFQTRSGAFKPAIRCDSKSSLLGRGFTTTASVLGKRVVVVCARNEKEEQTVVMDLARRKKVCLDTESNNLRNVILSDDGHTVIGRVDKAIYLYRIPDDF